MPRSSSGPWFYAAKNSWYVWHDSKRVNLKIKGESNEKDAVKAWHRLMAELPVEVESKPTSPVPNLAEAKPDVLTLSELVGLFLADAEARVKPASLRNYRIFLEPFAKAMKSTAPNALTTAQVDRFSKGQGWSQSYRCGFIGTVVSLLKWATDTGRLERNPIAGIKKPAKQSRGRKSIISSEDHARLVEHARGEFKAFLSLLWLTGSRPGEIAGLTAEDVDVANKCIVLAQHKTAEQTGKERLIVLCDDAVTILQRLVADRPEGLLFPGRNGRLTAQAIGRKMARLCEKAGVKPCMAYGYRHTFATDALSEGVPDATVAALMGHQGTTMLHKHYSHLTSKANVLRAALGQVRGKGEGKE